MTPMGIEVVITPDLQRLPAMGQIEDDVRASLEQAGIAARVITQLAPAWTTDWMSDEAKEKLRAYGIAPPHQTAAGAASLKLHAPAAGRGGAPVRSAAPPHASSPRSSAPRPARRCTSASTARSPSTISSPIKSLEPTPCQHSVFKNSPSSASAPRRPARWRSPSPSRGRARALRLRAGPVPHPARHHRWPGRAPQLLDQQPAQPPKQSRRAGDRHPPGRRRRVLQLGHAAVKAGDTLRSCRRTAASWSRSSAPSTASALPPARASRRSCRSPPARWKSSRNRNSRWSTATAACPAVMFNEALQDLKDRYRDRLTLIHILSRQAQEVDLLQGRIDGDKVRAVIKALLPVGAWTKSSSAARKR
jgi:metal-sulfur cluster biosynthetic enzyme